MTGRACDKFPSHGYAPDGICKWCEAPVAEPAPDTQPTTTMDELRRRYPNVRPNPLLVDKPYAEPAPIGFKVSDRPSHIDPRDPTHARTPGGVNDYDPRCLVCRLLGRAYFEAAGDEQAAP